jgi:hypothetical protein
MALRNGAVTRQEVDELKSPTRWYPDARQLAAAQGQNVTVSILEMGSSHIRSGAVIDPIALTDLLPNWKEKGASFATPVTEGRLLFLATVPPIYKSEARSHATPTPDATLECGHTIGPAGRLGYSVAAPEQPDVTCGV